MPSSRFMFRPRHAAASAEHIRDVAGSITDATVAELLAIGATAEEVELASAYARGEGDVVVRLHYTLTGRVKHIFDVLTRDDRTTRDASAAGAR